MPRRPGELHLDRARAKSSGSKVWRTADGPAAHAADPFARSELFSSAEMRSYPWERSLGSEEWVCLAATISDHLCLGPVRLTPLVNALRTAIDERGGVVRSHHETYALLAERV